MQVLGKDLSFEREKEVEMLLPNYTKWCGMSCGDIWTMMRHGREKEEFWRNKQNGDFFSGKTFLKRDFLPFSTNIYFQEKRLKRDLLQRLITEKDPKAFFSFNKGFRCFRKYTRFMKSYKILLIFLQQKL